MAAPLRVGVIGAGAISTGVHLPVLFNLPGCEVAWLADRDGRVARRAAGAFGIPSALAAEAAADLPDCDVALLAVPLHARREYMKRLSGRRTPVLVEKPFAVTGQEHREFMAAFGDTLVACGYMRRAYASVRTLRALVASGVFGSLRHIRYAEGGRVMRTGHSTATLDLPHTRGGGVLRDLGCHGLDAIGFMTGWPDVCVESCRIGWDLETDRHVEARLALRRTGGVTEADGDVSLEFCTSWIEDQPNRIDLQFERARVACGTGPASMATLAAEGLPGGECSLDLGLSGARSYYQAFALEWEDVLGAVRHGGSSEFHASGSLWTTSVVESLYGMGEAAS